MSIGLRLGTALLIKEVQFTDDNQGTAEGEVGTNGSTMVTFDYHFNKNESSFVPFIGGGIGYVSIANFGFGSDFNGNSSISNNEETNLDGKFGGMIRGGFEWGKFRLGLDYNFIPKSDLVNINREIVGSSKNNYLGINIGFFVGGGKW